MMDPLNSTAAAAVAWIALGALGVSWGATGLVRRYALARAILDVPNHRSSHTIPTPRGGGAAIVLAFAVGLAALGFFGIATMSHIAGIGGGAILIALIGWVDDRRSVAARYRFLVQVGAAVWALWWIGGLPVVGIGNTKLHLGLAGSLLAVIGTVWYTNLFNFMDGIDGIAGSQAATCGTVAAILLFLAGRLDLAAIALLVAAASIGFLIWNWSPARIFMGDVGSSMLGFVFATLAIGAENTGAVPLGVSLLLGAFFILDTTITLFRRVARGAKWYEAHRSHAYQRAVQSGFTHAQVSATVIVANVAIGCALIVTRNSSSGQIATVVGGILAVAALYLFVERRKPMHDQPTVTSTEPEDTDRVGAARDDRVAVGGS